MKNLPNKLKAFLPRTGDVDKDIEPVETTKPPEEVSDKVRKRRSFNTFSHDILAMFSPSHQGPTFKFEENDTVPGSIKTLHHSMSLRNFVLEKQYNFKASGKLELHKKENIYKERWVEVANSDLIILNKKQGKERMRLPLAAFSLEIYGEQSISHEKRLDSSTGYIFALTFESKRVQFSAYTREEWKNWIETFHILELRNFASIIDKEYTSKMDSLEGRMNDQFKILKGEDTWIMERFGPESYDKFSQVYEKKLQELNDGIHL